MSLKEEVPFVKFILYSVLLRLIALYFVTLKRVENWSLLLGSPVECRQSRQSLQQISSYTSVGFETTCVPL